VKIQVAIATIVISMILPTYIGAATIFKTIAMTAPSNWHIDKSIERGDKKFFDKKNSVIAFSRHGARIVFRRTPNVFEKNIGQPVAEIVVRKLNRSEPNSAKKLLEKYLNDSSAAQLEYKLFGQIKSIRKSGMNGYFAKMAGTINNLKFITRAWVFVDLNMSYHLTITGPFSETKMLKQEYAMLFGSVDIREVEKKGNKNSA